jgi:hypothetical protein
MSSEHPNMAFEISYEKGKSNAPDFSVLKHQEQASLRGCRGGGLMTAYEQGAIGPQGRTLSVEKPRSARLLMWWAHTDLNRGPKDYELPRNAANPVKS